MAKNANRYERLIADVFLRNHEPGRDTVEFDRDELSTVAAELGVRLPKNLGDVVYSFRYRTPLPEVVRACAPSGLKWIIMPAGRGRYRFQAVETDEILPDPMAAVVKVPDATPGMILRYAFTDEQALLAKLRYNRLLDVFLGVTCYSLQNHLRTTVPDMGQVETDEVYVGIRSGGEHYVIPVQAKGGSDRMSVVQIGQDFAMCEAKFPGLVCLPVAAQFMAANVIALFRFVMQDNVVRKATEKHYQLVPESDLSSDELDRYRQQSGSIF